MVWIERNLPLGDITSTVCETSRPQFSTSVETDTIDCVTSGSNGSDNLGCIHIVMRRVWGPLEVKALGDCRKLFDEVLQDIIKTGALVAAKMSVNVHK